MNTPTAEIYLPPLGHHQHDEVGRELQAALVELIDLSLIGKQLHWSVSGPCFDHFTSKRKRVIDSEGTSADVRHRPEVQSCDGRDAELAPRFVVSADHHKKGTDMSESTNTPTVVLVHGGFADASFWAPVIEDLQAHDVPVLAPPNPLRGLAHDSEYIASFVNQIDGPVLLVGHSYGGAVISVAGASTPNAVGLVYVAAFALDEGESFGEIFGQFGDTPLVGAVRPKRSYPHRGGETAEVELTIAPELYREAFAADVSEDVTRVLAVSQRPFAAIFEDRAEAAAWKTLPSWAVVATSDNAIPPDAERHMARRAGAQTIEVDASHSIALSQPTAVAELIRTAVESTSAVPSSA